MPPDCAVTLHVFSAQLQITRRNLHLVHTSYERNTIKVQAQSLLEFILWLAKTYSPKTDLF